MKMNGILLGLLHMIAACTASDNEAATNESNLYLSPSGYQKVAIANTDKRQDTNIKVCKTNGTATSEIYFSLDVWEDNELEDYNKKNGTTYTLLPSDTYEIADTKVIAAGKKDASIPISFYSEKMLDHAGASAGIYVLPLRLNSDDNEVDDSKKDVLLNVSLSIPTLGFRDSEMWQELSGETSAIKITAVLTQDGNRMLSKQSFKYSLMMPDNASDLVDQYNNENKKNCLLLPQNACEFTEGVYAADMSTSEYTLNVKRSDLESADYLLPLVICPKEGNGVLQGSDILMLHLNNNDTFTIGTYNILVAWDNDPNWENNRKDPVIQNMRMMEIVGIEEASYRQRTDIGNALQDDYDVYIVGRDKGTDAPDAGEMTGIFYMKNRFKVEDKGIFWFGPDPTKPYLTSDKYNRFCMWMKLKEIRSGKSFYVFKSHLPVGGDEMVNERLRCIKIIENKINELMRQEELPVVVMGDLNSLPWREDIKYLVNLYPDAWEIADQQVGPSYTFPGNQARGDMICVKGLNVHKAIVVESYNCSDHFPYYILSSFK